MLLDTLVKLASLGASGVGIFAIFWAGRLIHTAADTGKMKTYRFYMATAAVIVALSVVATGLNLYFDSNSLIVLQNQNSARTAELAQQKLEVEQLRGKLATREQEIVRAKDHIAIVLRSKAVSLEAKKGSATVKQSIRVLQELAKNP